MSEALEAVRDELSSWYLSLDPRTQAFLEAIYAQVPTVVVAAVTTGRVSADESAGHATLAALLEADPDSSASPLPYIGSATPLTINPEKLLTSSEPTVSWTDANYGRAIDSYADELAVLGATGEAVYQTRTSSMALGENGQQAVSVQIPRLAEGNYTLRVMHNADGVESQYMAYASRKIGLSSFSEMQFTVELDDANYGRPALPADGPNPGAFGPVDATEEYVPGEAPLADAPLAEDAPADAPAAVGGGSEQYVSVLPSEASEDGGDSYTQSVDGLSGGTSVAPEPEPEPFEQQPYESLADSSESESES